MNEVQTKKKGFLWICDLGKLGVDVQPKVTDLNKRS